MAVAILCVLWGVHSLSAHLVITRPDFCIFVPPECILMLAPSVHGYHNIYLCELLQRFYYQRTVPPVVVIGSLGKRVLILMYSTITVFYYGDPNPSIIKHK